MRRVLVVRRDVYDRLVALDTRNLSPEDEAVVMGATEDELLAAQHARESLRCAAAAPSN